MKGYTQKIKKALNKDIVNHFPHIFKIGDDMKTTHSGISRLVMLDRYAQKDIDLKTLKVGDLVLTVTKSDPRFPARGIGNVIDVDFDKKTCKIQVEEEFRSTLNENEIEKGIIERTFSEIDKPLELYYEQIAARVAKNMSSGEKSLDKRFNYQKEFYSELASNNFVPAGRILYGAGSGSEVTYFNCFVMPYIHDSRGGISDHRKQVMEIMSRGGGVGTNGSTLRPKNALAKGVGGKSSGAVSWLNDLSQLTHLVEQGGSRRGAQMIMMADWHPDILEFIISKMQNPRILQFLIKNSKEEAIVNLAKEKLDFIPLSDLEIETYRTIVDAKDKIKIPADVLEEAQDMLHVGGNYKVNNSDFLSGANISVLISKDFMEAVERDDYYKLRFPDVNNYDEKEKEYYNEHWQQCGDVRQWEKDHMQKVATYRKIKARELWDLINICATYSAEPGIFFIDNANKMTNAIGYGQKVIATNPCGEQPLAPYSVCNLGAVNLANMVDKITGKVNYIKLKKTVATAVRFLDNVIDSTPYFLEENEKQATGERRIGLGIMGLHDLLIYCGVGYGSSKGNKLVDEVMKTIAITAYETSIDLAKEKGSFPFLDEYGSRDLFVSSGYLKGMPESIRKDILNYGIRNSHLLTIAPTGSTGTMIGVSTGLEPYFAFKFFRSGRLGKFIEVNAQIVDDYLTYHPDVNDDELPKDIFVSAMDLSPEMHVDVQCIVQRWVDSSISKTVNAPKDYSVKDVEKVYEKLYKGGAKGGTVYVDGSRDSQVLVLKREEDKPTNGKQVSAMDLGVEFEEARRSNKEEIDEINPPRTKANRNIGIELGDICPICLEGTVENVGGCHTCTNCNAQLKCGL